MASRTNKNLSSDSNGKSNRKKLTNSADFLSNFGSAFFWKNKIEKSSDIMELSPNIELITGYSADEILELPGRKWGLVYEDDSYRVRKALADLQNLLGRNEIELIYRLVKKSNEIIWVKEKIFSDRNGKKLYQP